MKSLWADRPTQPSTIPATWLVSSAMCLWNSQSSGSHWRKSGTPSSTCPNPTETDTKVKRRTYLAELWNPTPYSGTNLKISYFHRASKGHYVVHSGIPEGTCSIMYINREKVKLKDEKIERIRINDNLHLQYKLYSEGIWSKWDAPRKLLFAVTKAKDVCCARWKIWLVGTIYAGLLVVGVWRQSICRESCTFYPPFDYSESVPMSYIELTR